MANEIKPEPTDGRRSLEDVVRCPACGKDEWKWIPDSLAQYCPCGFVRVQEMDGSWKKGASLQEWAADVYKARTSNH